MVSKFQSGKLCNLLVPAAYQAVHPRRCFGVSSIHRMLGLCACRSKISAWHEHHMIISCSNPPMPCVIHSPSQPEFLTSAASPSMSPWECPVWGGLQEAATCAEPSQATELHVHRASIFPTGPTKARPIPHSVCRASSCCS